VKTIRNDLEETKLIAAEKTGQALRETLANRPNTRQIIRTLFGKALAELTDDERARYRRLAKSVSYFRRHEKNKAQQRRTASWRKIELLSVLGWEAVCMECGYDRYIGALDFHHINPHDKEGRVTTVEEARKCRLLCANCHREAHREDYARGYQGAGRPFGALDPLLIPYMRLSGVSEDQIARVSANRPMSGLDRATRVITLDYTDQHQTLPVATPTNTEQHGPTPANDDVPMQADDVDHADIEADTLTDEQQQALHALRLSMPKIVPNTSAKTPANEADQTRTLDVTGLPVQANTPTVGKMNTWVVSSSRR
jgi:5-methylcytosine-specific restriction endonuclease McrA